MKSYRQELCFQVPGRRAFINITPQVEECLRENGIKEGLVLVNAMHITASVFINDDESGLLGDLNTAAIAGTGLTIALVIGDTKWTGTMYVTDLGPSFSADGLTTSSASMIGTLTLADQP